MLVYERATSGIRVYRDIDGACHGGMDNDDEAMMRRGKKKRIDVEKYLNAVFDCIFVHGIVRTCRELQKSI